MKSHKTATVAFADATVVNRSAEIALIPLQPGPFDFWAVAETLECLDKADAIREQLGRTPVRRAFVVNRAVRQTRLAREAIDTLERTNGAFIGVIHQRVAFSEAGARGESVLTRPGRRRGGD